MEENLVGDADGHKTLVVPVEEVGIEVVQIAGGIEDLGGAFGNSPNGVAVGPEYFASLVFLPGTEIVEESLRKDLLSLFLDDILVKGVGEEGLGREVPLLGHLQEAFVRVQSNEAVRTRD